MKLFHILRDRKYFLIAIFFFCFSQITLFASDKDRVLFISSYHPGFSSFFNQVNGIKDILSSREIVLDIEFLDSKRFSDNNSQALLKKAVEYKIKHSSEYDVIITGDDNASIFAYKNQNTLFNNIPIVFLGVNSSEFAQQQKNNEQITGVIESVSIADTINLIQMVHENCSEINIISDGTSSGKADFLRYRNVAEKYPDTAFNEIKLGSMSWDEYCTALENLDENIPVLFLSAYKDRYGTVKSFDESLFLLKKNYKGAVYHLWKHGIGSGMLGGKIISHYEQGRTAAKTALEILDGKLPGSIDIIEESPNKYVFDLNEIKRLGFSISDFPDASIIINKPFSLFEEYKKTIITVILLFCIISASLVFSVLNIITRRKAQKELSLSRDNYQTTFNSIGDAIISTDLDGFILKMNPVAENLTGWSFADAEKLHFSDVFRIINAFTREEADNPVDEVLATGIQVGLANHTVLLSKDGKEHHISDSCAPVIDTAGKQTGVVLVFRDVTESYNLQRKLNQQSKIDTLGQLAGGVAHDYNNQLAAITGYAELIARKAENPSLKKFAANILKASESGAGITKNLLSFARKEGSINDVFDLNSIVVQVTDILNHTLDKTITVNLCLHDDKVNIYGDKVHFQNAVLNLALNARDAVGKTGEISLETEIKEINEVLCCKSLFDIKPGVYGCVRVRDDGCGMDNETLEHIYEPFFTTKPFGKGTGLGLASVYSTVYNHGGALFVSSEISRGTVFEICIPVTDKSFNLLSARTPDSKINSADKSLKILFADDDELLRNMISEQLESLGHIIVTVSDGGEALDLFSKNRDSIDLVILDYIMPVISGDEVFKKIREIDAETKIIISSGYDEDKKEFSCLKDSNSLFLQKPFILKDLLSAVEILSDF